eukprot:m.1522398 g.1522398  ORF g.1522398 m.1522398 type:complete len:433 (+) comp25230_c0_seq20:127-1425(+)
MGISAKEPNCVESTLLPVPIPQGWARNCKPEASTYMVDLSAWGILGICIAEGVPGCYITRVKPNSAAAAARTSVHSHHSSICRGMKILNIESQDVQNMDRDELIDTLRKVCDTYKESSFAMSLEYDPVGFATVDNGEEKRRIDLYAFQAEWQGPPTQLLDTTMYLGSVTLPRPTNDLVVLTGRTAALTRGHVVGARVMAYDLVVCYAALVAVTPQGTEADMQRIHVLLDVHAIEAMKNVVYIVSMDRLPDDTHNLRTPMCHVYRMETDDAADYVVAQVAAMRSRGMQYVEDAVKGVYNPPILSYGVEQRGSTALPATRFNTLRLPRDGNGLGAKQPDTDNDSESGGADDDVDGINRANVVMQQLRLPPEDFEGVLLCFPESVDMAVIGNIWVFDMAVRGNIWEFDLIRVLVRCTCENASMCGSTTRGRHLKH